MDRYGHEIRPAQAAVHLHVTGEEVRHSHRPADVLAAAVARAGEVGDRDVLAVVGRDVVHGHAVGVEVVLAGLDDVDHVDRVGREQDALRRVLRIDVLDVAHAQVLARLGVGTRVVDPQLEARIRRRTTSSCPVVKVPPT